MLGISRGLSIFKHPRTAIYGHSTHGLYREREEYGRSILGSLRLSTTEAGEHESGHISTGPNEGIVFLDSMRVFTALIKKEA